MRLYRNKGIWQIQGSDVVKNIIFAIVLIVGLTLCPKANLYDLSSEGIKYYSLGIFLITMSMIYLFVNISINNNLKISVIKTITGVLLVTCTIISIIFVSLGGLEIIIGLSIFCGVVMGCLLNYII